VGGGLAPCCRVSVCVMCAHTDKGVGICASLTAVASSSRQNNNGFPGLLQDPGLFERRAAAVYVYVAQSPSELNAPAVASKRAAPRVFFLGQNRRFSFFCPFRRLDYAGRPMAHGPCQSISPGAFVRLWRQSTKHHHPQLAQRRCISAACAAFRACHQPAAVAPALALLLQAA
jgi:hypothetical protein